MPIYLIFRHFMGIWTLWFSGSNGQVRAGATTYIQQFRQLKKSDQKDPEAHLAFTVDNWQPLWSWLLAKLATRHTSVVKNWVSSHLQFNALVALSPLLDLSSPNVLLEPMTSPICCQNDCFFILHYNSILEKGGHLNRKTNSMDPMKS